MRDITPEILYSTWHKEIFLFKGTFVRAIKDFDKVRQKPEWRHFVACADIINRNDGMIDYLLFIRSLVEFCNGYVDPKLLSNRQSIRVYRNYIEKMELKNDIPQIKVNVENSIKFLVSYCVENKITLQQYFEKDKNLIPMFLKHINSGVISKCFVACLSDFYLIMANYPQDVINDFFIDYEESYKSFRSKFTCSNELKHFLDINTIKKIDEFIVKKLNN